MSLVQPRRPSGFQEYTPSEQIEFNRLVDIIRGVYEKYGFSPLDTPDIELTDVLLAGSGGETSKQLYRFKREGSDTDLTLRYDLTVPLARYVAEHQNDLAFPFRRYQIGKVHRAERAQAGRFREFYQADIDVIGSVSPSVDAELPAIINEIFDKFGFGEFVIKINNRQILNGFFEGLGLEGASSEVLRVIDKIDKISPEEFIASLYELGLSESQARSIVDFTSINGSVEDVMGRLYGLATDLPATFYEGVKKLSSVISSLRVLGVPEHRYVIDLKIARGLDYYTGTVYETFLVDHPGLGSVCSGGRYDNLAQNYTNTELPGVGVSIGLSRLFYKLREVGVIDPIKKTTASVLVTSIVPEDIPFATSVAAKLRYSGLSVVTYFDEVGVGKKFKYANKLGINYVVVIGEAEREAQKVSIKDMQSGETTALSVEEAVDYIQR